MTAWVTGLQMYCSNNSQIFTPELHKKCPVKQTYDVNDNSQVI